METSDIAWWMLLLLWTLSQIANNWQHRIHMRMHDNHIEFLRRQIARMESNDAR